MRALYVEHGLASRALEIAAGPNPDVSDMRQFQEAANIVRDKLTQLERLIGWQPGYLISSPLNNIAERVRDLCDQINAGPYWAAFEGARQTVGKGTASELLTPAMYRSGGFQEAM